MATYTNNVNRVTGLSSGMDIDSMVDQIMQAESSRYESLQKNKTWVSWQQDAYREVIDKLQTFQNKWFGSDSKFNLRYSAAFKSYSSTVKDASGNTSNAIKVNSINTSAECTIEVEQVAVKNSYSSTSQVKKGINTTKTQDEIIEQIKSSGEDGITLKFNLDGSTKEINIKASDLGISPDSESSEAETLNSSDKLVEVLNQKLTDAFGKDGDLSKVSVSSNSEGKLSFQTTSGHTLTITDGSSSSCSKFGITSGESSVTTEKTTLGDALGENFKNLIPEDGDDAVVLDFGGSKVSLTNDDTIETMINKINNSGAGFKISYSSLSETFKIEANEAGTSNEINITDENTKNFLKSCLNIDVDNKDTGYVAGQDAIFTIDGVRTSRTSNDIEFNGLNFSITEAAVGQKLTIKSEQNVDDIYNKIVEFVNEYNSLIEDLNSRISETRSKSDSYGYYEPLTDAEKEAMTEEEIEKWEKEAKTGLLYNDSVISSLLSNLRSALYTSIDTPNGSISLYEIGITTSSNWQENGKLVIDEDKLKEAIRTRGEDIQTLFTKQDDGVGDKVNKIIEGAIGRKNGSLRNKAGIKNTSSENENILSKQLKELAQRISEEKTRLANREARYYELFSAMENSISQQNAQLESLYQLLGS